jgi:NAD(P)H dehydrogenase (quinone)
MSIVVTGATGHLGRLTVQALLDRGVEAGEILAAGRSPDRLAALAAEGIPTAPIDFSDIETLRPALKGADRVLLVSGNELGRRVPQHQNVIRAAAEAGVELLVYTSAPYAERTSLQLAVEHRATEDALAAGGVPFAVLRNGWYFENYTAQIPVYLQTGRIVGAAGDGRISGAARADYAEAAAAVLTGEGHTGAVYELGGDEPFTMAELASELSRQAGREIPYENLTVEAYTEALLGAGLPEPVAAILADSDRGIAAGELLIETGDLRRLIGHSPATLAEVIAAALPDTIGGRS